MTPTNAYTLPDTYINIFGNRPIIPANNPPTSNPPANNPRQ